MASKIVLALVLVFDLIAFGLAVAAEQRRSTATITQDENDYYNYCTYDSDISTGYGAGAFVFFMASQVIIMVASQCFCCGKGLRPVGSRTWAIVLFIICWVFFTIGEISLLLGSVSNAYHTKYTTLVGGNDLQYCVEMRKGVFGAGAAFIFLNCIVSELYYVFFSKAKESFQPHGGEAAVGMGTYR